HPARTLPAPGNTTCLQGMIPDRGFAQMGHEEIPPVSWRVSRYRPAFARVTALVQRVLAKNPPPANPTDGHPTNSHLLAHPDQSDGQTGKSQNPAPDPRTSVCRSLFPHRPK